MQRQIPLVALLATALPLLTAGCGSTNDEDTAAYDQALLEQFRNALPSENNLSAGTPQESATRAIGDSATYPAHVVPVAHTLNGLTTGILQTLDMITSLPPTVYNSETREFIWGPWNNDDGYGKAFLYIRDEPEGADFDYSYAMVRVEGDDMATAAPVIWGGASPEADDPTLGSGITLWDFEANYTWEQTYDPGFDEFAPTNRGRFLSVYGAIDDATAQESYAFNVSMFRDFVSEDTGAGAAPTNTDYYFGRFESTSIDNPFHLTFFNWDMTADLCDAPSPDLHCFDEDAVTDANETMSVRLAFLNDGIGRAQATVSGGDLTEDINAIECWDDSIARTFLRYEVGSTSFQEGADVNACGPVFANTLTELNLPSIDRTTADYINMDCVARNGVGAEACQQL